MMKIAILSPIHWRTPPRKYGPWELISSYISEGLVKKGHDVTLFASGDSITTAKLRWVCPRPLKEDESLEVKVYQYLHSSLPFEDADNFDIIHNHYDAYPLVFSKLIKTPVISTIHGFSSPQISNIYRKYSNTGYVSISLADRINAPDLNYIANIYHGIPVENYEFNEKPKDYFCFIGRITKDKGIHHAISLAKKLGFKLKISGPVFDKVNEEYFNNEIKPNLNDQIEYSEGVYGEEKVKFLNNAIASFHLNDTWPEPFGLTLVEAMACGTPVIAINKGSISEIIENGKSGFVIDDIIQAEDAIKNIVNIDRLCCRKRVEDNFTVERMVDEYESVYKKITGLT